MTKLDAPGLEKGSSVLGSRPGIGYGGDIHASQALSLKRIADSLEKLATPAYVIKSDVDMDPEAVERLRAELGKAQPLIVTGIDGSVSVLGPIDGSVSVLGPKGLEVVPDTAMSPDPSVRLGSATPGLYLYEGELICKTEYSTETPGGGCKPDCYIVATGEYFCGGPGVKSHEIKDLRVTPVSVRLP